jgi:hypothetical protein
MKSNVFASLSIPLGCANEERIPSFDKILHSAQVEPTCRFRMTGKGEEFVLTKREFVRLIRSFIPHNLTHAPIQDDG